MMDAARTLMYVVEMDAPSRSATVQCAGCGWRGPFSDARDLDVTVLAPGDASPAGRCKVCDDLVHVVAGGPGLTGAAAELASALEEQEHLHGPFWAAVATVAAAGSSRRPR